MDPIYLSYEERPEHDLMMLEAGIDRMTGKILPSHEIKSNLVRIIRDAEQAQRSWAKYILDDALAEGLLSHWRSWNNKRERMKTIHNGVIKPVRAVRGTRVRNDDGKMVHQQAFWAERTWDQVRQQLTGSDARIAAEQVTKEIALKLLKLFFEVPDSQTVGEACERLGLDFEEYLTVDAAA